MYTILRCFAVCALLVLGLSACTSKYATNGENLYKKSRNGPTLVVPSPLSAANLSNFYVLPAQRNPNPEVSITPPTFV